MKTKTSKYVDGFVIPIKKKNVPAYKKMAEWGAEVWIKCGALEYFETIGDDLKVKKEMGESLGFEKMANIKPDETVIFAWVVYKSKAHRDSVNKKVMAEMAKSADKYNENSPMPFDTERFATGGFKAIVEA